MDDKKALSFEIDCTLPDLRDGTDAMSVEARADGSATLSFKNSTNGRSRVRVLTKDLIRAVRVLEAYEGHDPAGR